MEVLVGGVGIALMVAAIFGISNPKIYQDLQIPLNTRMKRGAAIGLTLNSLRPKGYQREMFAGRQARPLNATRIAALTDFVKLAMQQFDIPGVALSLIDRGQVVFEGTPDALRNAPEVRRNWLEVN